MQTYLVGLEAKMSESLPKEIIEQVKRSHTWLLRNVTIKKEDEDCENYSDELKHSLIVEELLELL